METTNVFATAARMIENSPQHCRKQRGLAGPEPLFGVGRADVAAIYLLGRT